MSDERANVRVLAALLSDDSRIENTGKEILIGIYTGDMLLDNFPTTLALRVMLIYEASGFGEVPLSIQLRVDAAEPMEISGFLQIKANLPQHYTYSLTSPPLLVTFAKSGELNIRVRSHQDEWQTIKIVRVRSRADQGETAFSTVSSSEPAPPPAQSRHASSSTG